MHKSSRVGSDQIRSEQRRGGTSALVHMEGKKRREGAVTKVTAAAKSEGEERDFQLEISFCGRHSLRRFQERNVKAQRRREE